MDQMRGVLYLADPLRTAERSGPDIERMLNVNQNATALIFRENERCLSQAQDALWALRRRAGWVCVAGEGAAAGVALALAAQLPVDRVALIGSRLFAPRVRRGRESALARQLARVDAYARRNLSLVIAEILLVDPGEGELRGLVRGLGRASGVRCGGAGTAFTLPWEGEM